MRRRRADGSASAGASDPQLPHLQTPRNRRRPDGARRGPVLPVASIGSTFRDHALMETTRTVEGSDDRR
jgi:hypothetical protein